MIKNLADVADRLRRAGATVPAPENKGSIESAMVTGLSIGLVLVEEAMTNSQDLQTLIKELEAEIAEMRAAMTQDLLVAGKMRGDLEAEIVKLKESTGVTHLLGLCTELQERVAFAEKDRDEALAEKDAVVAKTKEKMKRAGNRMAQLRRLTSDAVDFIFAGPLGERADDAAKLKSRAVEVLLDEVKES